MENKPLLSLFIKLLYINNHINKCVKRLENYLKKTHITLPLLIHKIIRISTIYTKHYFFKNIYITLSFENKNPVYP